jgi:hypothetical protein
MKKEAKMKIGLLGILETPKKELDMYKVWQVCEDTGIEPPLEVTNFIKQTEAVDPNLINLNDKKYDLAITTPEGCISKHTDRDGNPLVSIWVKDLPKDLIKIDITLYNYLGLKK